MQLLFQCDITKSRIDVEYLKELLIKEGADRETESFGVDIFSGTLEHIEEIDREIMEAAEHWTL
ncbi:MAG: hypothetical protein D6828_05090, partial [Nitrospirae bacterium]